VKDSPHKKNKVMYRTEIPEWIILLKRFKRFDSMRSLLQTPRKDA